MFADGGRRERFAYALVSAAPLQGLDATGIGIVFKAPDRRTTGTVSQALVGVEPVEGAYEAVRRVLEEALACGVRGLTIYVEPAEVVEQLRSNAPVPRPLLVTHLKTRGMINQLARVSLVAATSQAFSARVLAESARPPGFAGHEGELAQPRSSRRQLSLITEDKPAWRAS
jgi:hypothetical protein